MIGGLDLIIIEVVKNLVAPMIALTGSPLGATVFLYPVAIIVSKHLDRKIKERSKKWLVS